jgi:hypothetical protein
LWKLLEIKLIAGMNKKAILMNLKLKTLPPGLLNKLYVEEINLIKAINIKGRMIPEKKETMRRALTKVCPL